MNKHPLLLLFLFLLGGLLHTCTPSLQSRLRTDSNNAYVGTYTRDEGWVNGKAEGIYQLKVNAGNGRIESKELVAEVTNPSFVLESKNYSQPYVYAVSELAREGEPTGFLHVFSQRKEFTEIAKLPTDGKAPCYIAEDKEAEFIVTTNYVGGVAKLFRRKTDGTVFAADKFEIPDGLVPGKQPHLHSANFSPSNRVVAIADLGLDRLWMFLLDRANGKLVPHDQPYVQLAAGAGPRHTEWSADGRFLYVINELNGTVNVVSNDTAEDRFKVIQTISTLPADWTGKNSCADLHLHPSGNFLYGSNRGHNSIVMYAVNKATGMLQLIGHQPSGGDFPRNFAIAPTGKFLYVANQNTGNITLHGVNEKSGKLTSLGQSFAIGTPVCIEF